MKKRINLIILNKDLFSILIIILLSFFLILPFFKQGYFPTHDGEWAVVRLADMFREIKDLQIPPRYSGNLNFGYGYPLFNFAYPFPYYLGLIVKVFGFSFVASIKLLFAVSVPLSGIGMYLLSKNIWGNRFSGLLSAVLYIFLPYRLVDLYVRGSLGESLAFIYFPLIILSFYKIFYRKNIKFYSILLSFLLSFLIMTHNIMAVFFAPIVLMCLLTGLILREYEYLLYGVISCLTGILMSAFFWLPALFEKQFVSLSKIPIADRNLYFISPLDLLNSSWGYGIPTDQNAFTYQIGHAQIAGIIAVVLMFFYKLRKKEKSSIVVLSLIICMFLYILMLFRITHFLWKIIPLFKDINYPWTMLSIIGFLASIISGYICRVQKMKVLGLILTVFAILSLLPLAHPSVYVNRGDNFYVTNDATTTSSNEFMPLWVKEKPTFRFLEKVQIVNGEGVVKNLVSNSKQISFSTSLNTPVTVRINTIYYPGWQAYADNSETRINYENKNGIMEINIPKVTKQVNIIFSETRLRLMADFISAISFAVVTIFIFYSMISLLSLYFGKIR